MEDIRSYRESEDEKRSHIDDERIEFRAASDEEPPFHIPRD